MPAIFISFRDKDAKWVAQRLYVQLSSYFGSQQILLGVDALRRPNIDFQTHLEETLAETQVVTVVIGNEWRRRWIYNPDDMDHRVIETAFRMNRRVIVLLVDGAEIPPRDALVGQFKKLHDCPTLHLSVHTFGPEVNRLVTFMEDHLGISPNPTPPADMPRSHLEPVEREQTRTVIISYQREDTGWLAGRLHNTLGDRFGYQDMRLGVPSLIVPGTNPIETLEKSVQTCAGFMVLIGPNLLDNYKNTMDFDRSALALAMRERRPIIPVLVENASFPLPEMLPLELRSLTNFRPYRITSSTLDKDAKLLIQVLEDILDEAGQREGRLARLMRFINPRREEGEE